MGDRLARFGFALDNGQTVTPELMEQYLREQILSSYATAEGLSGFAPTPTSNNPYVQSEPLYLTEKADAVNAARESRGLNTRSFLGGGGFGGPTAVAPRQTYFTETAYGKDFWDTIFGGNPSNPDSFDIAGLGYSEEDALSSLSSAFANDTNFGLATFRGAQAQADALQKIRDSKISGGHIGGPLRVLSAGLGFPGSALPFAGSVASGVVESVADAVQGKNPSLMNLASVAGIPELLQGADILPKFTSGGLSVGPIVRQTGGVNFPYAWQNTGLDVARDLFGGALPPATIFGADDQPTRSDRQGYRGTQSGVVGPTVDRSDSGSSVTESTPTIPLDWGTPQFPWINDTSGGTQLSIPQTIGGGFSGPITVDTIKPGGVVPSGTIDAPTQPQPGGTSGDGTLAAILAGLGGVAVAGTGSGGTGTGGTGTGGTGVGDGGVGTLAATAIPETGASGYAQPMPGIDFANPFTPSMYGIPPAPNYFDYGYQRFI